MKIRHTTKYFSFFTYLVAGFCIASCLTGCVSVHTASIFAHDSLRFPTVGLNADETVSEGGLVVKTTPTWSDVDEAYTNSIQGGYVHSVVIPLERKVRLSLAGGISGYYAQNTLSGIFAGAESETKTFDGYGFTGQFKPSLYFGSRAGRFMIGGNFVYAKEFGDYLDFRHTFDALNANPSAIGTRLDFSPHGQTFSASIQYGFAYSLENDCAFLAEFSTGYFYPDFIYDRSPLLAFSGTLSYTGQHFWAWVGSEWLPYLNSGISVGVGFRIR